MEQRQVKFKIFDLKSTDNHVDLTPKKNPIIMPGNPKILYPSIPKKPETAILNLSNLVLFWSYFACES
jgi:hypothetical protein